VTQHPLPDGRLADLLQDAAEGLPVPAAPVPAIVERGARQRRLRRLRQAGAAAFAVLALAGAATFVYLRTPGDVRPASAPGCPARLVPQVVPEWARTGFSEAEPLMPLVLGDRGRIVAIVFGEPLLAPADDVQHSNKILWVPKEYGEHGPLLIDAVPESGGPAVHREVPEGPGPSGVDLPAAGCWRLTLTWGGGLTDTMSLRYTAPR
jgi:hypothetical protein